MRLRVCVIGCLHGELNAMYDAVSESERRTGVKVDVVLVCGDFQAVRDPEDLDSMAVPEKYKRVGDFQDYYLGRRIAPVLTLFVGGNHEASSYLSLLSHGGYVAPNIYYLGRAGVVTLGNRLRVCGVSGIYNAISYSTGLHEAEPYTPSAVRTVYHIREFDVLRVALYSKLSASQDCLVVVSHDWPRHVAYHGSLRTLLRKKPFFKDDVESGRLGAEPLEYLIKQITPDFWFAAHLHVRYAAVISKKELSTNRKTLNNFSKPEVENHTFDSRKETPVFNLSDARDVTRFLALDKILPGRGYMQLLDFEGDFEDKNLRYDADWLAVVKAMHGSVPRNRGIAFLDTNTESWLPQLKEAQEWVHLNITERHLLDVPTAKSEMGAEIQHQTFCQLLNIST